MGILKRHIERNRDFYSELTGSVVRAAFFGAVILGGGLAEAVWR